MALLTDAMLLFLRVKRLGASSAVRRKFAAKLEPRGELVNST